MNIKRLKRGSFTVEAAVIVPVAVMIIAALISYIYFMHERVWSKASAYEAAFYAVQRIEDNSSVEEKINERLSDRYDNRILGFSDNNSQISTSETKINIKWEYGIFEELFGDVFTVSNDVSVRVIDPVSIKRLAWTADYITD